MTPPTPEDFPRLSPELEAAAHELIGTHEPLPDEPRAATPDEIRRYEAGEQQVWECPRCGHTVEVLSGLMVFCQCCREKRHTLVGMRMRP